MDDKKPITLNEKDVTKEELDKEREKLPNGKKIVEIEENKFRVLERLHG